MRYSVYSALVMVLVWAALGLLASRDSPAPSPAERLAPLPPAETAAAPQTRPEAEVPGFDRSYRLPVLVEGMVVRMDLHDYLTGVVLAEVPVSFAEEALKAQATACRTYALRSCQHRRHEQAAVCTDSGCCQGWRDPDTADPGARARAEAAVSATDGLVICYDGALIDATFFSCSGGRTEAAAAVWGSDLPYLQAVDSPGEEAAAHYADETRVPLDSFRSTLEALDPELRLPDDPGSWIGGSTETPGGGVEALVLGGRSFRGTVLRKAFGLRSTAFTLALTAEEAVFTTRGYGHRVGMSQYGADAMARAGNDYETILKWYYTGVEILPAEKAAGG